MLSRTIADTDAAHDAAVQAGLRYLPQEKNSLCAAVKALPQRTQTQLDAYASILRSTCQEFGITVVTYINKTRLKMGAKLLKGSALSVFDIAQECGFSSAEYFSNLFKKEYGCSPLIYRQRNKEAEA